MNERLKELWNRSNHDEEVFAELIVRECAAIVWNDKDSQRMLKHFGVE